APSKGARTTVGPASTVRSGKALRFEDIMDEPGQTVRLQRLMDFYADLDPAQFEAEADKLDDLPFSQRIMAAFLLFSRWAEVAPEEALAYSDGMGMGGFFVKPTILQSWASTNPEGAAKYFEENQKDFRFMGRFGGRGGGSPASQIAGEWARQSPEAALKWAQSLDGNDSQAALSGVFQQVALDDPAKAAAMAGDLTGEARQQANLTVAREWGSQNYAGAEEWIATLPADEQAAARSQALRGLAGDDPQLAAEKVSTIPEGDARDAAVETIAESWAREDPAGAAQWLVTNGSEGAQEDAIRGVMVNWARTDADQARDWLAEQPAGTMRDRAAATYVFAGADEPQAALEVAETIEDMGSRSRAIGMTAARWMQEDREAALEYVETTEALDDENRGRILERVENLGTGDGPGPRGGFRGPGPGGR
ncbi:MAG: hypothetical protein HKO57_04845, partial [Akkermansiaceae bacterium]|nr:hypothetical protein [Akkermansiaceae bacterium]